MRKADRTIALGIENRNFMVQAFSHLKAQAAIPRFVGCHNPVRKPQNDPTVWFCFRSSFGPIPRLHFKSFPRCQDRFTGSMSMDIRMPSGSFNRCCITPKERLSFPMALSRIMI